MQTLGEDVLLLAIGQDGTIAARDTMSFALAGSELMRLAALRRVDIVKGRIVVVDPTPTRDFLLDAAFASMRASKRPPRVKNWIIRQDRKVTQDYLEKLAASGALRYEPHRTLGVFRSDRWFIVDSARVRRLEAQLDTIAFSSGPLDFSQAAFGGLVYAAGLASVLYPKHKNRPARKRLEWLAGCDEIAWAVVEAARARRAAAANAGLVAAGV